MSKINRPRHGSLQIYPRKRVRRFLPRVNWAHISKTAKIDSEGILGIIGYKVGMSTAIVRDNTDKSMTKGRDIALPVTIIEVPNMKVFSVRAYKNNLPVKDIIVSNDKELKKIVKIPKEPKKFENEITGLDFDDLHVLLYSIPKQTSIKKTPDMTEININSPNKIEFVKNLIGKELTLSDILKWKLVDIRAITKGKGLQGAVRRFGITLKSHKSEKGRRRPGSLGPWHPHRVTFRTPMAGQLGTFSRVHYNFKVIDSGSIKEKNINLNQGFKHYGKINTNYIVVSGSVQGPPKRQILITPAMRPNRKQSKKNYELINLEGRK